MASPSDLKEWDRRHLWHPFTQMRDWVRTDPVVVEEGDGCWLIDVDRRRWLDGVGSIWTNVHGHRKRELDEALVAQSRKIAHSTLLGLSNVPAIELAKRLAEITRLPRVFYSDNGATAVEVALKMALQYWQHRGEPKRSRFVRFDGSYHGDTLGAVSIGGIDLFHAAFRPLLFQSIGAPNPSRVRSPDNCIAALRKIFEENSGTLAAIVIEPRVQGAAGILVSPPSFLQQVRALCDEHRVLLIADEVATGFGRIGPMWACESAGITPDMMCVAKGISGGYLPLAATLTSEEVYSAFLGPYEEMKTFFHGHTYTGNPLACAVAIASCELFEKEKILERSKRRIAHLAKRLGEISSRHVVEIRQAGFMVGIDLGDHPWTEKRGVNACLAAREKGVLLRPLGNVVVLNPPLAISEEEIDLLVGAAAHGIERAFA